MSGVHQDHAGHQLRVLAGVDTGDGAAPGLADEDVGGTETGLQQQAVELVDALLQASRRRARLALAGAGRIVAADAGEPGDLRLHPVPVRGGAAAAGDEHHGRGSLPRGPQVQPAAADIHELPGRGGRDRLLGGVGHGGGQHGGERWPEEGRKHRLWYGLGAS